MRVRALLGIAALVVVAGCQAGPTTAAGPTTTTRSTAKTTTTTPPPRYTPKPDGSTPHHTIRFRLDIVDGDSHLILIPVTSNPNPVHDPTSAKQLRQDPALATDPAAQQRAAASLDCGQPDPLTGQDDASLPLVTCGGDDAAFLGPAILDGSMIAGASYSRGGPLPNRWDVTVDFTPAGGKILAEMVPKNLNRLLGMLFDGDLAASTILTEKSVGSLVFTVQTEDDARQLAAIINNR